MVYTEDRGRKASDTRVDGDDVVSVGRDDDQWDITTMVGDRKERRNIRISPLRPTSLTNVSTSWHYHNLQTPLYLERLFL